MKLKYTRDLPKSNEPIVMVNEAGHRVECHLRGEADGQTCLIALSGSNTEATKQKLLGPFVNAAHAIAARNAIGQSLMERQYKLADGPPIWALAAQRAIRSQRQRKVGKTSAYRFDPKDVFLDW